MKKEIDNKKDIDELSSKDLFLQQLLYLKGYERPSSERIIRSKQIIMQKVREVKSTRMSLGERIELHLPWLFAEPRYGIALLFIVFGLLQFWGVTLQESRQIRKNKYVGELPLINRLDSKSDVIISSITNQSDYLKETSNTDLIFPGMQRKRSLEDFVAGVKEE